LKQRAFRMLFCGQAVSNVGDWLDFLALNVLVAYRWELGAAALASLAIARMLPIAVCGPIGGVWADRLPRRELMIACDLIRAGLVLGLVWAPNLYVVLALILFKMLVSAFFDPAQLATLRSIVPEDRLLQANALSMMSLQSSKVLAPLLGGMLVTILSPQAIFAIDSATFLISALFISRLPFIPAGTTAPKEEEGQEAGDRKRVRRFWEDFREGVTYVLSRRLLVLVLTCMSVGMFIVFLYDSFLVLLAAEAGIAETGYGIIVSAVALGNVLGMTATAQWGKGLNPLRALVAAGVVAGLAVAAAGLGGLGYGASYAAALQASAWFLTGLAGGTLYVFCGYLMQVETPAELMGRVWSLANTLQGGLPLIAPAIGALVVAWIGVGRLFVAAGLAFLLLAVASGTYIRLTRLRPPRVEQREAVDMPTPS